MKNVNLILVAIILAGVFYLSFTEKSPAKPTPAQVEMMSIHQYLSLSGSLSLIVIHSNGEVEEIEIETPKGNIKEKSIAWSKSIHEALDKYYDLGWRLDGNLSEGRSVLYREK